MPTCPHVAPNSMPVSTCSQQCGLLLCVAAAKKPFALSKWLSVGKGRGGGGRGSGAHTARVASDQKLVSALAKTLPAARKATMTAPANISGLSEALSREMRQGKTEFNRTHADALESAS